MIREGIPKEVTSEKRPEACETTRGQDTCEKKFDIRNYNSKDRERRIGGRFKNNKEVNVARAK